MIPMYYEVTVWEIIIIMHESIQTKCLFGGVLHSILLFSEMKGEFEPKKVNSYANDESSFICI